MPVDDTDPEVRDMSYDRSRDRQLWDLLKDSLIDFGFEAHDDLVGDAPKDRLEIFIKERSRGPGYVADIVYQSQDLPVVVYAVLVDRGRGLEMAELELFRRSWGGDEEADVESSHDVHAPLITATLLRQIPIGQIIARAQHSLAAATWREEGIVKLGIDGQEHVPPDEFSDAERRSLESAAGATRKTSIQRGRPSLPDSLLEEVAHSYLAEAANGPGLTRRLAAKFDRPEATVRDWISAARKRGFLSAAVAGKRSASPGPRLL